MTIAQLHSAFNSKQKTKQEVLSECFRAIDAQEGCLNAFISFADRQALWQKAGTPFRSDLPLDGIPFSLKDNFMTQTMRSTCASLMLDAFVPPYDATVCERLEKAGALLIGKTNMDSFAMGVATDTSHYKATRNPLNPSLSAGGSSGGSAAAVKSGMCLFSIASDTGGSARQPAAYCGAIAMKPTYGRISRFGLTAFANSLDTVSIITNNVADSLLILRCLSGVDGRDMTCVDAPPYQMPTKPRIAYMTHTFSDELEWLAQRLGDDGFQLTKVPSFFTTDWMDAYNDISAYEATSNLARFDGTRFGLRGPIDEVRNRGFEPSVKKRLAHGASLCTAQYRAALCVRQQIADNFHALFDRFDLLLCPANKVPAFTLGTEYTSLECDFFLAPANMAGLPALVIPYQTGGIQLIGPKWSEDLLYQIGHWIGERESA